MALSNTHFTAMRVSTIVLLTMFLLPAFGQEGQNETEQVDIISLIKLGFEHYKKGDYEEAFRWFKAAAEQGFPGAQYYLGNMYSKGQGVPQDYKEAVRWYRQAAERRLAVSQFNLALMYDLGQGVPQDYKEAARWYSRAAEQGQADAQINLGFNYDYGRGVPQDYVRAHMWYNLAVSRSTGKDRERAVKNRDRIATKMTAEQIAEAQRLAREWKPKSSGSQ